MKFNIIDEDDKMVQLYWRGATGKTVTSMTGMRLGK
jgi:hypothetical protein